MATDSRKMLKMLCPIYFLLFGSLLLLSMAHFSASSLTNDELEQGQQNTTAPEYGEMNINVPQQAENCDIHHNEALHALMDRICELCHDMYSHHRPNMRADCRSDCFRSSNFKRCLRMFRPTFSTKNRRVRHLAKQWMEG